MKIEEIKKKLCEIIDTEAEQIVNAGIEILKNPELGFKEEKTSKFVRKWFDELGIEYSYPLAVTGVNGILKSGREGPNICIIGEMDAVKSPQHPFADLESGGAHACGHHAQIAMMLGVATAFVKSGIIKELCGQITFFAVPAEEFVELGFRRRLRAANKIQYFGGKQELIAMGEFDDIDIAMMIHGQANMPQKKLYLSGSSLGFVAENIHFQGKEAHGAEPFEGVNALNAAMLALMGIHANRETFKEADKIRIHPIVTKGGDLVNTVPAEVEMETYIRGSNLEAIRDACHKVDRSLKGAADMVGAKVEISGTSGYLPLHQDKNLTSVLEKNAHLLMPDEDIIHGIDMIGSTDMGDLSHLIPCLHPSMGGYVGDAHSKDFCVFDTSAAYLEPAKLLAMTIADLLFDNAQITKAIKASFVPLLSKKDYLNYLKERD